VLAGPPLNDIPPTYTLVPLTVMPPPSPVPSAVFTPFFQYTAWLLSTPAKYISEPGVQAGADPLEDFLQPATPTVHAIVISNQKLKLFIIRFRFF
jgi:hypothetical protein